MDHPTALPAASALLSALCAGTSTTAAQSITPGADSTTCTETPAAPGIRSLELLLAGDGMWELPAGLGALTGLERLTLRQSAAFNKCRALDSDTRMKSELHIPTWVGLAAASCELLARACLPRSCTCGPDP